MKFCETCGNLLKVKMDLDEKFLYCKSCDKKNKLDEQVNITTASDTNKSNIIVINENEEDTFPVTEVMCPKCDTMRKAQWTMQQTRGGDEPPTRFYQCTTCDWRWREYS